MENLTPTRNEEIEALRLMSLVGDKQIELDALEARVQESMGTLRKLEEAKEALDEHTSQISLSEELLSTKTQEAAKLTKQVGDLEERKAKLKEANAVLADEATAWKDQIDASQKEVKRLKKETEAQKLLETQRLEGANHAHLDRLNQIAQEKQEAENSLASVRTEVGIQEEKLVSIQKKIAEAETAQAKSELEHKSTVDSLAKDVFALQQTKAALIKEQDSIVQKAQEAVTALVQDKDAITEELKTLRSELEALSTQKTEAQSFVETKLSEIASAKRAALIEISNAMSQARTDEVTEQLAGAINSINNT